MPRTCLRNGKVSYGGPSNFSHTVVLADAFNIFPLMFFLKIHKNNTFLGKKIQLVEKWEPSFAPPIPFYRLHL